MISEVSHALPAPQAASLVRPFAAERVEEASRTEESGNTLMNLRRFTGLRTVQLATRR